MRKGRGGENDEDDSELEAREHFISFGLLVGIMAKLNKNKIPNPKSIQRKYNKLIKKYNLKECYVRLNRVKPPHEKIIEKNISISIKGGKMKVNGIEIEEICERVFNFGLKLSDGGQMKVIRPDVLKVNEAPAIQKTVVKTLHQLTEQEWRKCKKERKEKETQIQIDQHVMAKMKSYSPWPGRISTISKNGTSAQVYFFGSHNKGSVKTAEIVPLHEAREVIRLLLLRPNYSQFSKGIREAEISLGIPQELSITNQQNALLNSL